MHYVKHNPNYIFLPCRLARSPRSWGPILIWWWRNVAASCQWPASPVPGSGDCHRPVRTLDSSRCLGPPPPSRRSVGFDGGSCTSQLILKVESRVVDERWKQKWGKVDAEAKMHNPLAWVSRWIRDLFKNEHDKENNLYFGMVLSNT